MVTRAKRTHLACAAIVLAACASRADAQRIGLPGFGANFSVSLPTEGLQNRYKVGFGGALVLEPMQPRTWSATGEIGVTRMLGQTRIDEFGIEQRTNDLNYWEFSGGVRRKLGASPWFVGVDGAYYVFSLNGTNGLPDQGGVLPAFGFRAPGLGITARYKLGGSAHWVQLRLTLNGFR